MIDFKQTISGFYSREQKKEESTKENLKGILTAQELEDAWRKERDQFQLADRITGVIDCCSLL